MKKVLAILLFQLLFSSISFSQQAIKGRVVVSTNGTPVPGCSVFINNTSKGTIADNNGYFELNDISPGKHELIVSSIGYETNVFSFSSDQLPLQLRIELDVKIKELQNVNIEPWVEEGWERWGKLFSDNFIGRTPNATHCKIKNEKAIKFRYYKKSNRVVAIADEPIVLENKALGYKINYQLEQFEVNFKTNICIFFGYPFFEDMDTNRDRKMGKWKRSRDEAYYGSMMHFMRSLYADRLSQEGFEAKRMFKTPNEEKERIKKIYRAGRVVSTTQKKGLIITTTENGELLNAPQDSLRYYERIMHEKDFKEIYANDLLTADSLIIRSEGQYKFLFFTDYLFITYKNETEDENFLRFSGQTRKPDFQRSFIIIPDPGPIEIDINGNYPPQEILALGYWSWSEKMADFLPLDYKP